MTQKRRPFHLFLIHQNLPNRQSTREKCGLNAGMGQFLKFRDDPKPKDFRRFSERENAIFKEIKTDYTTLVVNSEFVYGIGAAIVLPDYYRLKEDSALARKNLTHPYHLCAQTVLMEAGMQMDEHNARFGGDNTSFLQPIFDSHEDHAPRMKRAFAKFKEKNPVSSKYLLPPEYRTENDNRALQAADNLAYETRRYLLHRHFNSPLVPRVAMSRMLNAGSVLRLYKLDYRSMKLITENQSEDHIPFGPEEVSMGDISNNEVGVEPNDG